MCLIACFLLAARTAHLIYLDHFGPMGAVSNRSFAPAAAGFSLVASSYFSFGTDRFSLHLRLLAWPVLLVIGYLGIGLGLIVLNDLVGAMLK